MTPAGDPRLVVLAHVVFASAAVVALDVCAFGMISLVTDTDVIDLEGTDAILGVAMVAASAIVVFIGCTRAAVRIMAAHERGERIRVPVAGALLTGIGAGVAYAAIGGMLYAAAQGQLVAFPILVWHVVQRPYWIALMVIGAAVHLSLSLVLAVRGESPRRPRWPWERDG